MPHAVPKNIQGKGLVHQLLLVVPGILRQIAKLSQDTCTLEHLVHGPDVWLDEAVQNSDLLKEGRVLKRLECQLLPFLINISVAELSLIIKRWLCGIGIGAWNLFCLLTPLASVHEVEMQVNVQAH